MNLHILHTPMDAIRLLCEALIRDDFAYGSDRLKEIIARAERMEADRDVLQQRVERLSHAFLTLWKLHGGFKGNVGLEFYGLMSGDLGDETGGGADVTDLITRDDAIRDLIRLAEHARIPDSEGGWDIRYDVADWLRDQLSDEGDEST